MYDLCSHFCGCFLTTHISFSLCCALQQKEYTFISANFTTEFWESVFRLTIWLHKGQSIFSLGLNRSGLGLIIFHKLSLRTHHNHYCNKSLQTLLFGGKSYYSKFYAFFSNHLTTKFKEVLKKAIGKKSNLFFFLLLDHGSSSSPSSSSSWSLERLQNQFL